MVKERQERTIDGIRRGAELSGAYESEGWVRLEERVDDFRILFRFDAAGAVDHAAARAYASGRRF